MLKYVTSSFIKVLSLILALIIDALEGMHRYIERATIDSTPTFVVAGTIPYARA